MEPRGVSAGEARFVVVDDKETFWDRFDTGRWEPETLEAVCALARPRTLLIDIGAWVGPVTLTAAALGASVMALEPDSRAFELLDANIGANPWLKERIVCVAKAAAPRAGRVGLGSPRKKGDSMGSVLAFGRGRLDWEAEAITPSEIAARAGEAERIVIKIDIEGAEYDLVPALTPLLGDSTAALLIAFHPRLMEAAGRSPSEIEAATRAALASLAAFRPRTLEPGLGPGVSTTANSTVLFERPGRA